MAARRALSAGLGAWMSTALTLGQTRRALRGFFYAQLSRAIGTCFREWASAWSRLARQRWLARIVRRRQSLPSLARSWAGWHMLTVLIRAAPGTELLAHKLLALLARLTTRRCSLIVNTWRALARACQRMRCLAAKAARCCAAAWTRAKRRAAQAWKVAVGCAKASRHASRCMARRAPRGVITAVFRAWATVREFSETRAALHARVHRACARHERAWIISVALGAVRGWKKLSEYRAGLRMAQAAHAALTCELRETQERNAHLVTLLHEARSLL